MKNRGVENFYRLSSVDPAQASYELPGGLRSPSTRLDPPVAGQGFLQLAGVVSPCQEPQGWAFPSLPLTEDVDLLLKWWSARIIGENL